MPLGEAAWFQTGFAVRALLGQMNRFKAAIFQSRWLRTFFS